MPCTLSVVATHQLLTQIFTHLCHRVSQSAELRKVAGTSVYVNKATLEELERLLRLLNPHRRLAKKMPLELQMRHVETPIEKASMKNHVAR